MEMEQLMKRQLAKWKAEMKADREEWKAEMKAGQEEIKAEMKADQGKMVARLEAKIEEMKSGQVPEWVPLKGKWRTV